MKALILTLTAATVFFSSLQSAQACSITPQYDSRLRVLALHDTLDQMEFMTGFKTLNDTDYEISVHSYNNDQDEMRVYRLQNTSPMCPEYKATRLN